MSKQEAIEVIATGLPTKEKLTYAECLAYAEGICDRIAPLIRGEFPQEAYQKVIDDVWCRGHNYVAAPKRQDPDWENTDDLLEEAKRLWEGREALREGDNVPEQEKPVDPNPLRFEDISGSSSIALQPKDTCQTCGGSRKVPIQAYEPSYIPEDEEGEHWKVCPDCKVTCQKCGGSGEIPYPGIVHHASGVKNSIDACPNCGGTGKERRSGEERREPFKYFHGIVTDDNYPDDQVRVYNRPGKDIGWLHDRRTPPDRRKAG